MSCNIDFCFLSFADGAFKGTVKRSNSSDLATIVAARESIKTDIREFIEQQRQSLGELKINDENDLTDDDESTDSSSSNSSFDYEHFGDTPPHSQPTTKDPGFSEVYSKYVNNGEESNEDVWKSYNKRGEYGMFVHWNSWRLVLCCGVQQLSSV